MDKKTRGGFKLLLYSTLISNSLLHKWNVSCDCKIMNIRHTKTGKLQLNQRNSKEALKNKQKNLPGVVHGGGLGELDSDAVDVVVVGEVGHAGQVEGVGVGQSHAFVVVLYVLWLDVSISVQCLCV